MPSIFIAIATVDDRELIPTVLGAINQAKYPEDVYFGISYVGTDKLEFDRLVREVAPFSERVTLSFTELTKSNKDSVLGVGVNRVAAMSMYGGQDYVLQVDSHTLFSPRWDSALVALHGQAKTQLSREKVILTAYAGQYYFDKQDGTRRFKVGHDVFQYPQFIKDTWFIKDGNVIPLWNAVMLTDEQTKGKRFVPASKFNANFAFGDSWFAHNSGLEADFMFFDEELRQTVNLIEAGATLVHPIVEKPIIGHLYSGDFTPGGPGSRMSITDYSFSKDPVADVRSRTRINFERFLANPEKAKAIRAYEKYMKVSLRFGTARDAVYIPEYFLGEEVQFSKPVRPWDLLNPNKERASDAVRQARLDICRSCKFFVSLTQQCTKCGCVMPAKTTLAEASCPVHKWGPTTELSS